MIKYKIHVLNRINRRLHRLYPNTSSELLEQRMRAFIERFDEDQREADEINYWDESDIFLITYADMVHQTDKKPIAVLHEFVKKELSGLISTIHLLPIFPYSSDDGFSVKDYKQVDKESGEWYDIERLSQDFKLMFDFVLNHASAKGEWFKEFLRGVAPERDYFITLPEDTDVSQVTRPRSSPLLTEANTNKGKKYVWTTFSADQVDLDFSNPDVLFVFLDIMLFYVEKGADVLRMDAIAYLWKELGTNCIHHPKTHEMVKLFRDILEIVSPETILLTETNVPHEENISYFGENDEAHMVYQFSLPPLLLHGLLNQRADVISKWASDLTETTSQQTFLNFTSSHDGIGMRPLQGLITDEEIQHLANHAKKNAGRISMKRNSDGSESPYELNITYFDALKKDTDDLQQTVERYLISQSVMLALKGIPAVYFNNLFGSTNYLSGFTHTGRARTLNRQKWNIHNLRNQLESDHQHMGNVFEFYKKMLKVRRDEQAFHPNASQKVVELSHDGVFAFTRGDDEILCLFNFTEETIPLVDISLDVNPRDYQLLFSNNTDIENDLAPLGFYWMKKE